MMEKDSVFTDIYISLDKNRKRKKGTGIEQE